MESCIPRQRPRNGTLFSRAYLIAVILPSIPRSPNPPGTRIPCTSPSTSATLSSFSSSESTHLIFTVACWKIPPCFKASTTEIYASCSWIYLPTSAISTSLFGLRSACTISIQSVRSGSGQSSFRHSHATWARFSFSIASGASYKYSTSRFCSTHFFGTLQNNAILSRIWRSSSCSVRHTIISGWIPIP